MDQDNILRFDWGTKTCSDNQNLCHGLKPGLPEYEAVVAHIQNDSDCGVV